MTTRNESPAWPLYRALVGIGMACGLLIAVVFVATEPVIAQKRAEALEKAVFSVLPGAERRVTFVLTAEGVLQVGSGTDGGSVYAGYDADGQLVGVAIPASGLGYQDEISVLYGYAPATETVVGFQVLGSMETPGLGDKIGKDARFLENFVALDVRLDSTGRQIANPIEVVARGRKKHAWQIDGITGATISANAVGAIMKKSTAEWVPVVAANVGRLEAGAAQ